MTIIEFLEARYKESRISRYRMRHVWESCLIPAKDCVKLRRLAAEWHDHPDYQDEWRLL